MKIGAGIQSLVSKCRLIYVGTSDTTGEVHLATTRKLMVLDDRHVSLEEWFCHRTLENLKVNPQLTIGVVASDTGKGYQLIGEVDEINESAVLNGFVEDRERECSTHPQSKYQISARIDLILELDPGPHSDEAIE